MNALSTTATQEKKEDFVEPINFIPTLPITEWSVLALMAVLLIRHLLAVNTKLIDEILEENDDK